jgi:hypothetical protein
MTAPVDGVRAGPAAAEPIRLGLFIGSINYSSCGATLWPVSGATSTVWLTPDLYEKTRTHDRE